jgi:hypothetical protein
VLYVELCCCQRTRYPNPAAGVDDIVDPAKLCSMSVAVKSAFHYDPASFFLQESTPPHPPFSNNHLCNALPTKSFASYELLVFQPRQCVKGGRDQQHHRSGDQTAASAVNDQTEPLHQAHDTIYASSHVVGGEATDEGVETGRGWADSEKKGNLDEDED